MSIVNEVNTVGIDMSVLCPQDSPRPLVLLAELGTGNIPLPVQACWCGDVDGHVLGSGSRAASYNMLVGTCVWMYNVFWGRPT